VRKKLQDVARLLASSWRQLQAYIEGDTGSKPVIPGSDDVRKDLIGGGSLPGSTFASAGEAGRTAEINVCVCRRGRNERDQASRSVYYADGDRTRAHTLEEEGTMDHRPRSQAEAVDATMDCCHCCIIRFSLLLVLVHGRPGLAADSGRT